MRRPGLWLPVLLAALALGPAAAGAAESDAKKAARPHYEKGATEYNLGHFPEAISEFEQAYKMDPAPILLFNIAQAHRQNNNYERAAFFYRRYLEQAPTAVNRAEVEKRIKELEEAIKQQSELRRRPPTEVAKDEREVPRVAQQNDAATPSPPAATPPPTSGGPVSTVAEQAPPPGAPDHRVRVMLSAGPSFPKFSGRTLDQPTLLSVRAGAGYRFDVSAEGALDVGLSVAFAPMQYRTTDTNASQNASLWGGLVTAMYRHRVLPALEVQGELGAGVIWWGGLGEHNPFTVDGIGSSGPVPMPSFLVGLGANYRLPYSLFVFAEPAFVYSKTTGPGLSSAISSVSRLELALGLGYAL